MPAPITTTRRLPPSAAFSTPRSAARHRRRHPGGERRRALERIIGELEAGREPELALDLEQYPHQPVAVEAEAVERLPLQTHEVGWRHAQLARERGEDRGADGLGHGGSRLDGRSPA